MRVRFAGIGTSGPQGIAPVAVIGPGSKFRPDRCRRLTRPLLWRPASLTEERGGPVPSMLFPPSVFPLWKHPVRDPPFHRNTPKGANRRGQQHGGFTGAAEETAEPRPAAHRVDGTGPPLGPEGPGALVRPGIHLPGLSWCSQAHPISAATPCPPCAGRPRPGSSLPSLFHPVIDQRVGALEFDPKKNLSGQRISIP